MTPNAPVDAATRGRPPWFIDRDARGEPFGFPAEAVETSVGDRLQLVAGEHPDRTALCGPGGTRTHGQLAARVSGWAADIAHRASDDAQVAPAAVAVLAAHDVGLMEALLAVMTAGHPVLVLDPTAPSALNTTLLEDAGASLVLADAEHLEQAAELGGRRQIIELEALDPEAAEVPVVDPGAPAMYAYTSGSSGQAKAAVVPHRQLLQMVRGATETLAVAPDDRLPMLFPLSLAVASYPALLPLLNGASLTTFDVRGQGFGDLPTWLVEEQVTVAYLAPTVVRFLEDVAGGHDYESLRLIVLGGERVDHGVVELTRSLFGRDLLIANGYGTTETGVLSFWFAEDVGHAEETVPAGYPIDGMELRVVGDGGRPVPAGRIGELEVISDYLFAGYRGAPDLDRQVLRRDEDGKRAVYRTGDLARVDDRGVLTLAGRTDEQIKVRGRRVVLGEVEELLLALPGIGDAAVVADFDTHGHAAVAAHVVPADPADSLTPDAIRQALREQAPVQMLPAFITLHDALPLLPNGKIDRRSLTGDRGRRPDLSTAYIEPSEELEEQVVRLWEDLLGVRPIGVEDDFFDLGGDSLLASRMLIELEARLGHRIAMAALIDGASPRSLARTIADDGSRSLTDSVVVQVQAGDPRRPVLYLAHDLHGSAFRFRHLAAALSPDQPVMGFESPALTGAPFPFETIEALAERYVDDLVAHQPSGPYFLGGYSFGGILAFEMARILRRRGEEVPLLAVVDIGPGYRGIDYDRRRPPRGPWLDLPEPAPPGAGSAVRARHFVRALAQSPRDIGSYLVYSSRLRRRLLPIAWRRQIRREGRVPPRHRLWYAYQMHWDLVGPSWSGAPYDGMINLFWSESTEATDDTMGWAATGADVAVHRIDVDHERVMDTEQVQVLAKALGPVLALAR